MVPKQVQSQSGETTHLDEFQGTDFVLLNNLSSPRIVVVDRTQPSGMTPSWSYTDYIPARGTSTKKPTSTLFVFA